MNDYDKAGRYLVKREPTGFFCWLLANPSVTCHAWVDARRVVLPKQNDLTNDLVAVVRSGEALEVICLELEAEARADTLVRLLLYLARLWSEPARPDRLPVSCVSGAILDLTGRSPAQTLSLQSTIVPGCRLELSVRRRHLVDEDAWELVADVAAGEISPWLLGWVPLMRGGAESAIIASWRVEAQRLLTDERDRADLGTLTLTFATLARCRPVWEQGLRGWNMNTSPFLDEIRAEARGEGRADGARAIMLRVGRQKFRKAPSRKQQKALEAMTDLAQLEALGERLLRATSWAELLNEGAT